jgi:hypothetical protein
MKAASPGQSLRTLMKDAVAEKASAN